MLQLAKVKILYISLYMGSNKVTFYSNNKA